MKMLRNFIFGLTALSAAQMAHATAVYIELALVIDVSGSVNTSEYNLMMDGYAAAFNDATVQSNIDSLSSGAGIGVFFFSSSASSVYLETILSSAADAAAFATSIGSLTRPGNLGNMTDIADGIIAATAWLTGNNYDSTDLIMDVSGDGEDNDGSSLSAARTAALNIGITINGLPIGDAALATYYPKFLNRKHGYNSK